MEFTDEDGERKLCHTTSWGLTTRMIGAVVMTHGDDNGLRVPPRIAPRQVRIVPITRDDPTAVLQAADELQAEIAAQSWEGVPVRAEVDTRARKPAEKRWEWIRKGVPMVIELGERDIEGGVVTVTRRDDPGLSRDAIPREDVGEAVVGVLGDIQLGYYQEASELPSRAHTRRHHDAGRVPRVLLGRRDRVRRLRQGSMERGGGDDRDDGRARRQRARHPL